MDEYGEEGVILTLKKYQSITFQTAEARVVKRFFDVNQPFEFLRAQFFMP